MMEGVNLTYIVSIYVNITMYPLYNYYILIKTQVNLTININAKVINWDRPLGR
jgi:hypothetical protein